MLDTDVNSNIPAYSVYSVMKYRVLKDIVLKLIKFGRVTALSKCAAPTVE